MSVLLHDPCAKQKLTVTDMLPSIRPWPRRGPSALGQPPSQPPPPRPSPAGALCSPLLPQLQVSRRAGAEFRSCWSHWVAACVAGLFYVVASLNPDSHPGHPRWLPRPLP